MFRFEDNKCYRMPAHFGGWVFDPNAQAIYHDDGPTLGNPGWLLSLWIRLDYSQNQEGGLRDERVF